ncbi:MAG: DUF3795 domain-containing protein [Bacillota bacterium]
MLGYCGINCNECTAYKGTITGDISLLEKAAGSYWGGAYSAKDWVCLGCRPADQPILAKFCAECKIRKCAVGRGIQNCAACAHFENCSQLHDFIKGESEALVQTMTWLRQRFLDGQRKASS